MNRKQVEQGTVEQGHSTAKAGVRKEKVNMENGSIIEAMNIIEYAKRTPPEIAAQNNNASGRKYIQDCIMRNRERFTDDELATLKAWWFKFYKKVKAGA